MSRENVNVAAPTLCMTTPTGVCGIDLDGPHVISPPPVPTTAAPRIAPRLRVPIAGAIADLIAGVMTKPDRLSTASAIAQTSGYSAVAHPNVKPLSRPEHDRMANAIRALAVVSVPCFELFFALPEAERNAVVGAAKSMSRSRPGFARAGTRSSDPPAVSSA